VPASCATLSASAAGGFVAQSGTNVLVTCRSSVRRRWTAASDPDLPVEPFRSGHSSRQPTWRKRPFDTPQRLWLPERQVWGRTGP